MRTIILLIAVTAGCALGGAQPAASKNPRPRAEIRGQISKVILDREDGPMIEVKSIDGRVWTVWLGAMRYLVNENFNPKAGQAVSLTAYEKPDCPGLDKQECPELLAMSVTLTGSGQTVLLRDAAGRPVWRCPRCARAAKK